MKKLTSILLALLFFSCEGNNPPLVSAPTPDTYGETQGVVDLMSMSNSNHTKAEGIRGELIDSLIANTMGVYNLDDQAYDKLYKLIDDYLTGAEQAAFDRVKNYKIDVAALDNAETIQETLLMRKRVRND